MKECTDEIGNELDLCIELLEKQGTLTPWEFDSRKKRAAEALGMAVMRFVVTATETGLTQGDSPEPEYDQDRQRLGIALQKLVLRKLARQ